MSDAELSSKEVKLLYCTLAFVPYRFSPQNDFPLLNGASDIQKNNAHILF